MYYVGKYLLKKLILKGSFNIMVVTPWEKNILSPISMLEYIKRKQNKKVTQQKKLSPKEMKLQKTQLLVSE